MVKGNVFNLYQMNLGEYIFANEINNVNEVNSISDLDFDKAINTFKMKEISIGEGVLNDFSNITMKFFIIQDKEGKEVSWKPLYEQVTGTECKLKNRSQSYLLFIFCNGGDDFESKLFAITGGHGHHKITTHIKNSFPFNLANRLIDNIESFSYIKQNNLVGQETVQERGFIGNYNVLSENNYWAVNREANIRMSKEKLKEIGLEIQKSNSGVNLGRGFKIVKSITLEELLKIVDNIVSKLDEDEGDIKLNRIVPVQKKDKEVRLYYELFKKLK